MSRTVAQIKLYINFKIDEKADTANLMIQARIKVVRK